MFRLLRDLFSSMSLERKCLLFFGSALIALMCGAFCVVLLLANRLVRVNTSTRAQDFGAAELYRLHNNAAWSQVAQPGAVAPTHQVLREFRDELLSKEMEFELLALDDAQAYENMSVGHQPTTPAERQLLEDLEPRFRGELRLRYAAGLPNVTEDLDLGENEAMSRVGLFNKPVSTERGPIDGKYVYYKPVFPKLECFTCHSPQGQTISRDDPIRLAEQAPFRVMKVTMPYEATVDTEVWIKAILIAMAMLIIAVGLYVLHAIVRYLVIQPLLHLRDVSDAITHGDTSQRATIDTEDEFRQLADAFNRMLRHLTETQNQIQDVNRELDARVDQLAQLNLQLYEANRLKSDFLANMSHELRTPLNSIIGFSEVLQDIDSLDEKQRRYASNIQKSGRMLLEMINDILDLAKVEAGKMEVRCNEFQLSRLVAAQCDMIQSLSEDKKISVTVEIPDDLPPAFQDQNKLGQILNNLLSNAIKFTPEGGMITVGVTDLDDGRFRLSVRDTGVGIAEEDQRIVFQKFRQSKKVLDGEGLTREFAGTGLGLSIVKELGKLLGGEVDFVSELGHGSTFFVTLPWRLNEDAAMSMRPAGPPRLEVSSAAAPDGSPS
jgi:signal transduction histidine kinase